MLKILWKKGKIAPEEQFLPLSTIFYYLMFDFYVKTGIRFSLRDKRLFEITEVEITRGDCILNQGLVDTAVWMRLLCPSEKPSKTAADDTFIYLVFHFYLSDKLRLMFHVIPLQRIHM